MVPRLIFASLVFCSLASRPDGATAHRRGAADARPAQAQATVAPPTPRTACP